MPRTNVPLPPIALADRVGRGATFEEIGRRTRAEILARLPEGWSFTGRRVLDFGCGAGRTLRHFLDEARTCELHGCDIDGPSVSWLAENLSPPLRVFQNEEAPPLPLGDDSFDLVWAISVFTHISDHWSGWLVSCTEFSEAAASSSRRSPDPTGRRSGHECLRTRGPRERSWCARPTGWG